MYFCFLTLSLIIFRNTYVFKCNMRKKSNNKQHRKQKERLKIDRFYSFTYLNKVGIKTATNT